MPDLDLYEDNFPHGTLAGYSKGCSGLTCPLEQDPDYLSCREVSKAVQGQAVVRLGRFDKVSRGAEPVRPHEAPKPAPPLTKVPSAPMTVRADEIADSEPLRARLEAEIDATFTAALAQPEHNTSVDEPTKKRGAPAPHGTVLTHTRGCRTDEECPNNEIAGAITCKEARRQYDHERHVRRQAEQAVRRQTSAGEPAAATDITSPPAETPTEETTVPLNIETGLAPEPPSGAAEPAPEETSVPDPAPIAAAAVDVVEAGYPDVVDQPENTERDRQLAEATEQLQRVTGEKIRLEQDLERAHGEITRLERELAIITEIRDERDHELDEATIQLEAARAELAASDLVVAGTGGESPPALAESIELTVRGVHLSLPADTALEVRALGEAVFVRAGR